MNHTDFTNKALTIAVALLAITSGCSLIGKQSEPVLRACTQEAKLCPDGSSVGRTGPNCEFAPCPGPQPSPSPQPISQSSPGDQSCTSDSNCSSGYVCVSSCGPPVARVGDPPPPSYCETKEEAAKPRECPKCLAGTTLIDTPAGPIQVRDMRIGMPIWTTDANGRRIAGVVTKVSKVPVPPSHQMVHLVLSDKRELFVSPGHPTADGRTVGDLTVGDRYDGASVVGTQRVPYDERATYDVLPSGTTSFYWANGVLLGSTLHTIY